MDDPRIPPRSTLPAWATLNAIIIPLSSRNYQHTNHKYLSAAANERLMQLAVLGIEWKKISALMADEGFTTPQGAPVPVPTLQGVWYRKATEEQRRGRKRLGVAGEKLDPSGQIPDVSAF